LGFFAQKIWAFLAHHRDDFGQSVVVQLKVSLLNWCCCYCKTSIFSI